MIFPIDPKEEQQRNKQDQEQPVAARSDDNAKSAPPITDYASL